MSGTWSKSAAPRMHEFIRHEAAAACLLGGNVCSRDAKLSDLSASLTPASPGSISHAGYWLVGVKAYAGWPAVFTVRWYQPITEPRARAWPL